MLVQSLILPDFPRPEIARILSPNGRPAHWAEAHRAKLVVRDYVAFYATQCGLKQMQGMVRVTPVYTFPGHQKHDSDNLSTGVLKHVIDTIVRSGYLKDDDLSHLRLLPVEVTVEKGNRQLELRFEWNGPNE